MKVKQTRITRWLDWPKWLTFGLVFLGFLYIAVSRIDPDFGWHLREGRELLAGTYTGGVYSYPAADYHWSAHEWLSDIVLAFIFDFGGYYLLAVVYAALYTLAFYWVARDKLGLVAFLAMLVCLPFAGIRTLVWTLLGFAALYKILHAKNHHFRWLIPPLLWLWSALHGSFLIGGVYVGFWFIKERNWRLFALGALGAVLTLINPFGLDLYRELAVIMLDSELSSQIAEWQSGVNGNLWALILFTGLWATSFFNFHFSRRLRDLKQLWRFDLLLILAALKTIRHWPLFALAAIPATDRGLRHIAAQIQPFQSTVQGRRASRGLVIAALAATLAVTVYALIQLPKPLGLTGIAARDYPVAAKDYLAEHGCAGQLFNIYDYGGWLTLTLPSVPTYIDGRMPSWRRPADTTLGEPNERYMTTYLSVLHDANTRAAEFAKWGITCVLIPEYDINLFHDLSADPDWQIVVHDPIGAKLFIKSPALTLPM
jgi:hypothetical protein